MSEQLVRFGVSMNARLLQKFDRAIARRGYSSRSEAIRDIVRNLLVEDEWQDDGKDVAGTISLVYDHHAGGLSQLLDQLQHDHYRQIVSTLHVHLDHDNCLEVLVVRGPAREVKEIADRLVSTKGVKHGKLTITSTGREIS